MIKIQMVDLKGQYDKIKEEINRGIQQVLDTTAFINGPQVTQFTEHLADYCQVKHVIPCANGTDALQIALMALDLEPGSEIIVPAFTYVATAEVIGLLGLTPVMVDVDYNTFNIDCTLIEQAITPRTRAIVPVHLFGQSCDMEAILQLAQQYNLYVIEDNAQAIGADYQFSNGKTQKTGTIGTIGCTSFFPSKNLGCYGDGGALMTNDTELAEKIKIIANHGQKRKYYHDLIGCNSRLDTLQATILDVKLNYLDGYSEARRQAAHYYTAQLWDISGLIVPEESSYSTHVYHQYTLKVLHNKRDDLKNWLSNAGIPTMIYYPLPLQEQEAFKTISVAGSTLNTAKILSGSVLSLPIHTEMTPAQQDYIIQHIKQFFAQS